MTFLHDRVSARGHQVDYLTAEDLPAAAAGRWSRFSFGALVLLRATEAARQGRPYDIVNVHEPSSAPMAVGAKAAGSPKVVVTSHGLEQRAWSLGLEERRLGRSGPSYKSRVSYPLTSLWQSALGLRFASHVFCLNEEDKTYLQERMGLSPQSVTRIFPAADPVFARAAGDRPYVRAKRLLFAATWRKNKGIEDFVPAVISVLQARPEVSLTILGGGFPEEQILPSFPPSLHSRVSCLRCSSDEETAAVFAQNDIFVLPSLFEGTPLTLLEAMMSGLPLVTTSTCGMRDVIRHGENGLLVPMRDANALIHALNALLDDSARREKLGRSARDEALNRYTWDRVAVPVWQCYEQLLSEG